GGAKITYADLDRQANRLAHFLRARGVGPDVLVGVAMERSIDLVVALLGVLKAGGAYVPLDPSHPRARVELMIADARASLLLTQQRLLPVFAGAAPTVIALDAEGAVIAGESAEAPACAATMDHLAYVIYTSGSTGRPKGVMISHRALLNYLDWAT